MKSYGYPASGLPVAVTFKPVVPAILKDHYLCILSGLKSLEFWTLCIYLFIEDVVCNVVDVFSLQFLATTSVMGD